MLDRAKHYGNCLAFNTTSAELHLQESSSRTGNALITFGILDYEGKAIGQTMVMDRTTARQMFLPN